MYDSDNQKDNETCGRKKTSCEASYDSLCENIKSSCGGNESDAEPELDARSPPWLLALHAAERRLEEQRLIEQSTTIINDLETCASMSCADNDTCSSVLNKANKNAERQAFIKAQARQLEKLKAVEQTTPTECLRSRAGPTSSCSNTSNQGNARGNTRDRCGANRSIDLTTESDDDDDDDDVGACHDDLDGFIVNDDDDDSYGHADFYPDGSSQVFGDSDDDDINANGERLIGRNTLVQCPLCGEYFPDAIIQFHAATCYL